MAAKTTTNHKDQKTLVAKQAFFASLFDLSWRLAGAMLSPIFIGLFIDSKRGEGQMFAYIGFVVGMVLGVMVIRSVVNKLSKEAQK